MTLRMNERKLRGEREVAGDMECVKIIDRLDRLRDAWRAHQEAQGPDWKGEYESACDAIERLLKRAYQLECQRDAAMAAKARADARAERRMHRELLRLREERDDAHERAKHAFAMGRRSATVRSAA